MTLSPRTRLDPPWLWPALVLLAVLGVACSLLPRPWAILALPLIGLVGLRLHGHGLAPAVSWAAALGLALAAVAVLPVPRWVVSSATLAAGLATALVVVSRDTQLWWLTVLPAGLRGQPWAVRVEVGAFSEATQRGNALFGRINDEGPSDAARRELEGLRADARRQRVNARVWRGAWEAFMAQLDTVAAMLDAEDPSTFAAALEERSLAVRAATLEATAETRRMDPFGVWIEEPGVGMVEDGQGRPLPGASRAGEG
ncbi:MAG: hypothetical protein U0838_17560 [Chloroflexota bacterium]